MRLGYNTNGFAQHQTGDALTTLSDLGYECVALTLERDHLDPPNRTGMNACIDLLQPLLRASGLRPTIETGSRFILDPERKHQPTLISDREEDRKIRIEFIKAAIGVAAGLSAESVSLWSGTPENAEGDADGGTANGDMVFERLAASLRELLRYAEPRGVRLAFEPEPGMFIDTMARYEKLHTELNHPLFGLTLDAGHVHCLQDGDIGDIIRRWRDVLWNIHIEDMRAGKHKHLMFGEGDMNFPPIFDALRETIYAGPIHVELSPHSHVAEETARQSLDFLKRFAR